MRKVSKFRQVCVKYNPKLEFSVSVLIGQNSDEVLWTIVVNERK